MSMLAMQELGYFQHTNKVIPKNKDNSNEKRITQNIVQLQN